MHPPVVPDPAPTSRPRTSREAAELADAWSARLYNPLPIAVARAEGCWIEDLEGRRYLDFLGGIAVMVHGHRHPRLVAAAVEQLGRVTHVSRGVHSDILGPFVRDLAAATGFGRAIVLNTGAEAAEAGIKLVRRWAYRVKGVADGRAEIVVAQGNFHGRTLGALSASTEEKYRAGFGPLLPGFVAVPFGDLAAATRAVGPHTAAVMVEPIQGEAGVVLPPDGWLAGLRKLCTERHVLLVCDEIQTGLGRTGRWFAWQHEDARPDVMLLGKALGGGILPVSAVVADAAVMDVLGPGDHGSTLGGNPLAAAVAREALAVIRDEALPERSAREGAWFQERLRALASPHVAAIRGRGLFVGVDIRRESGTGRVFAERCLAEGILTKDTHGQTLRFAPPLTITRAELEGAVARIGRALAGA